MFGSEDYKDIEFLKQEFNKMKDGSGHKALHEDDFEALIDHYEVAGDTENWQLACELSTEIYPFSSGLLLRKAEWLLIDKQTEQALEIVQKIQHITPGDLDSLLLHAEILIESKKSKEAIDLLHNEIERYAKNEQILILMELADIYDEQAHYDKVYETLKSVLRMNPHFEDALVRMCFWADVTKQQQDCIEFHKGLLDEFPLYSSAWYNLGLLYQSVKEFEEAVEAYENCLALDSKFEYALRNLGECYIQGKQYDKAIAALEEHTSVAKEEDVILESLAFCYERKKQFAQARAYYRKASLLNPEDDTIFFKLGETYVEERQWEKAVKSFSVALHLDKKNTTYYLALGNCLMELEAAEEALVCFLNAIEIKPSSKSIWRALIEALYKSDYLNEALHQAELAVDNCGDKVEFEYYKAGILLALGKTKEAIMYLENALVRNVKKVKCLNQLDDAILQHPVFAELYARYKK